MKQDDKTEQKKLDKREREAKVARRKSDISASVIRHNMAMKKLVDSINDTLDACRELSANFGNQRELVARARMTERVLNSSIRMINGNKLQLWMIDDRSIDDDIERDEK